MLVKAALLTVTLAVMMIWSVWHASPHSTAHRVPASVHQTVGSEEDTAATEMGLVMNVMMVIMELIVKRVVQRTV